MLDELVPADAARAPAQEPDLEGPILVDPDHGFHLKAADVEKAITPKTRVLLMNTPSNPTGA